MRGWISIFVLLLNTIDSISLVSFHSKQSLMLRGGSAAQQEQSGPTVDDKIIRADSHDKSCQHSHNNFTIDFASTELASEILTLLKKPADDISNFPRLEPAFRYLTRSLNIGSKLCVVTNSIVFDLEKKRLFKKLCYTDFPALMPFEFEDSEQAYSEDAELVGLRSMLSRANFDLYEPTAQIGRLRNGKTVHAQLIFADEETGAVSWIIRPPTMATKTSICQPARLDRILCCSKSVVPPFKTDVTWTTVLEELPSIAQGGPGGNTKSEVSAGHACAFEAWRRSFGLLGIGRQLRMLGSPEAPHDNARNLLANDTRYEGEVLKLEPQTNMWEKVAWSNLRVGDLVRVEKLEYFPADILVLDASTPSEICIQTACLDGDGSLRQRQASAPF